MSYQENSSQNYIALEPNTANAIRNRQSNSYMSIVHESNLMEALKNPMKRRNRNEQLIEKFRITFVILDLVNL